MTTDGQRQTPGQEEAAASPDRSRQERHAKGSRAPTFYSYAIRFRDGQPRFRAASRIPRLKREEVVMVPTDHGLEPALIVAPAPLPMLDPHRPPPATFTIARRANREEREKYAALPGREREAFAFCRRRIEHHGLIMKLIRVERFFNGSKIIFYFTAEKRVDFRALVKDLVQEFRTRVEMRQVGVRHETKMLGGLGCCGRELCCASFMKKFAPVSIKMAKAQELPLNPAKISGLCNRLLCCLTYEYETYLQARQDMPRSNKRIMLDGTVYKVTQVQPLERTVTVIDPEAPQESRVLAEEEWRRATPVQPPPPKKKKPAKK